MACQRGVGLRTRYLGLNASYYRRVRQLDGMGVGFEFVGTVPHASAPIRMHEDYFHLIEEQPFPHRGDTGSVTSESMTFSNWKAVHSSLPFA